METFSSADTRNSYELLSDAVKTSDAGLFQKGLLLGGDVNMFVVLTQKEQEFTMDIPYPLLVYVLGRKTLNKDIYAMIMKKKPDVLQASGSGLTPLMAAAVYNHYKEFDELLALGANVNIIHAFLQVNTLYFAVKGGNMHLVKRCILEFGQDPLQVDCGGDTLVRAAAISGHNEVVKYIIEEWGGDFQRAGSQGWTPFVTAACTGNIDLVKYLYDVCKVDPCHTIAAGSNSAVFAAAAQGHLEVVRYLVEVCGVKDIDRKFYNGYTAIHIAAEIGRVDVVKYLDQECSADLNIAEDIQHCTAFLGAAGMGHLSVIKYFCGERRPVDLDRANKDGWMALRLARCQKRSEVVTYMIDNLCSAVRARDLSRVRQILADPSNTHSTCISSTYMPVRPIVNGEYGRFELRTPLSTFLCFILIVLRLLTWILFYHTQVLPLKTSLMISSICSRLQWVLMSMQSALKSAYRRHLMPKI